MQWCGLKFITELALILHVVVTTDAVVWIEIPRSAALRILGLVTTDAVVWIEIFSICLILFFGVGSPLMQWCGLKCIPYTFTVQRIKVTTDAVVWIEISMNRNAPY